MGHGSHSYVKIYQRLSPNGPDHPMMGPNFETLGYISYHIPHVPMIMTHHLISLVATCVAMFSTYCKNSIISSPMTVSTVISPSCSNGVFLRFSQLWKAVPEFEHAYKDLHTDGMRQEPWEKGRLEIFVAQRFSAPAKI